jgi:xanthine dehydrogenase accessory factor
VSSSRLIVLVRGAGDVGSAVAHALFRRGHAVVLHDGPAPAATRRGMAFTDAVFDGQAELAGVRATRVDDAQHLAAVMSAGAGIAVLVISLDRLLAILAPDVIVDARMRKRHHPERQRGWAPLTIGLGPNFTAGATTDLVVETQWGESLGAVLTHGTTLPLAGEPRAIGGHGRERFVYAPIAGTFATARAVGDMVMPGDVVARIDAVALTAPLGGMLRGLTRDGVPVAKGTKVVEIDPRGDEGVSEGIGERPGRIAEGVCGAIDEWSRGRQTRATPA